MTDHRVAVVGGSLAGLRAAEQLRAAGHEGPITVYSAEPHPPYNRPPLSKEVLADPDLADADAMVARLAFRRRASVEDVDFRLGAVPTWPPESSPGWAPTVRKVPTRSTAWWPRPGCCRAG
jgi:NADPH-dependent 2,4-dienoyl-CoA reductase/sulfur reductase-like enzyme